MFVSHEDIVIENLWFEHEEFIRQVEFEEMYCNDAGIEPTPSEEQVIQEITEYDDYMELISTSEEYVSGYKAIIEELGEIFESGSENLDFSDQSVIINTIEEIGKVIYLDLLKAGLPWNNISDLKDQDEDQLREHWDDMKVALEDFLEALESKIDSSNWHDQFSPEDTIITLNSHDSTLEVFTRGDIFPDKGGCDEISIRLQVDSMDIAHGSITRSYGDYEIEDTGAAIATNTDDLWVDLREISKELRLYVDQKLDFISRIRDEIDDKF